MPPGVQRPVETRRNVFCTIKSLEADAFYLAKTEGMKDALIFIVHSFEYSGEETLEYKGRRYIIDRAYAAKHNKTELTAREALGDG